MRLFTDGTQVVLRTPKFVVRWRKGEDPAAERKGAKNVTTDSRSGLLAVTPSGEKDFTKELESLGVVDAVATTEDQVAALIEEDGTLMLACGAVPSDDGDWATSIDLSEMQPHRVNWPSGLIWGTEAIPYSETTLATNTSMLHTSKWGVTLVSSDNGVVAVLRPGSQQVSFALALPAGPDVHCDAEATEAGVLVTLRAEEGSALLHFDETGSILAQRSVLDPAPAISLNGAPLLYDHEKKWLYLLDKSLEPTTKKRVPFVPLEAVASHDGRSFALADAATVLLGTLTKTDKLKVIDTFDYKSFLKKQRSASSSRAKLLYDPKRPHGPPAVGFPSGKSAPPWKAAAGKSFEFSMFARSVGGPGKGIKVVLSGDATNKAEFETLEAGGHTTPFTKQDDGTYVADVADLELSEGVMYPFDPKPKNENQKLAAQDLLDETQFELRVRGTARSASSDLLAVSVSALRSKSPPLKWMRPLTIS